MREPMARPLREIVSVGRRVACCESPCRRPLPTREPRTTHHARTVTPSSPILSVPAALEKVGTGTLCVLSEERARQNLRPRPHRRRPARPRPRPARQMGSAPDQLERPPGAAGGLGGEDRPAREGEAGAAEDARSSRFETGPAHPRPGQHRRPHHARAGGPARRRPLEARRARGPARRLRPVPARPRLPRNCPPAPASPCSGGGSAWWMPRACPRCAAGSSASSPRATAWPSPPRWRTKPIRSTN